MSAPNGSVYRVHLAEPGGSTSEIDVPTDAFEAGEQGIVLGGTTVVPWHRVIRYTREMTQPVDDVFLARSEVRVWLDDGTSEGEALTVRADRFETGRWTVDLMVERTLNLEGGVFHLTKLHVPWSRVLEYERLAIPVEVPTRPD